MATSLDREKKCELRYVYLYRTDEERKVEFTEEETALKEHTRQAFYGTDYFNQMIVVEGDIEKDSMSSAWGIWPGSHNGSENVAAQSYTLYGNESTGEAYGKDDKSPFDCKDKRYLSIIQIHIAPEIFARLGVDKEKSNLENLKPLVSELQNILEKFCSEQGKDTVCKIYYMLSSGDFAIVTASNDVTASYRLSTMIRCRKISETINGKDTEWILFKTYTLLVVRCETEEKGWPKDETKVVIRGCYSNLYWRDYRQCGAELMSRKIGINPGTALNGRYDFSVEMTLEEYDGFLQCLEKNKEPDDEDKETIRWLYYLKKKHYVSYINRRILIQNAEAKKMVNYINHQGDMELVSEKIVLNTSGKTMLREKIDGHIGTVLKYYKEALSLVNEIPGYRKNLRHNLHLLQKLILSCRSINDVSDTRIYAVVLLKQILVVLKSFKEFTKIYMQSGTDKNILDEMDGYLQESLRSINVYAEYIRNNNLQTLQMPNYNVETSSSVEKLLIGYSEFVRMIYEGIKNTEFLSIESAVPIVVPALDADVVSVEVMFADGTGQDWEAEKSIHQSKEKLVILKSPTQTELSYMSTMAFSLLHEIAHQLRYETRVERNKAVAAICVGRLAHIIAENISGMFQRITSERDIGYEASVLLESCVKKAYLDIFWGESADDDFNTPLAFFKKQLVAYWTNFFLAYGQPAQLEEDAKAYLQETIQYFDYSNECLKKDILDIYEKIREVEGDTEDEKIVDKLQSLVAAIADYGDKIGRQCKDKEKKARLAGICQALQVRIITQGERYFCDRKLKKKVEDDLYEGLCEKWEEKYKEKKAAGQDLKSWNVFGRWMGIDVKGSAYNKKVFIKIIEGVSESAWKGLENLFSMCIGQYREETADIFMCKTGNLSAEDYITLILTNVSADPEIENKLIKRILRVMAVVYCGEMDEDTTLKLLEQLIEIIKAAEDRMKDAIELGNAAQVPCENLKIAQENAKARLDALIGTEESLVQAGRMKGENGVVNEYQDKLEALKQALRELVEEAEKYSDKCKGGILSKDPRLIHKNLKKIRHYIKMAAVMSQLIGKASREVTVFKFQEHEYYTDLVKGASAYERKKYLDKNSKLSKFSFEKLMPIYPKEEESGKSRGEYNRFCIETLLDLFYTQKIKYAQNPDIE
ncbi:hypothetical protein [Claveliimonas bilis]|uniref:hypothetical protein n=1 Tax=Claveliimonas bilis TaxID=3028070 RepID=UPI00292DD02B|nr:hypothetical protein [Claveliimonas bilis]BDZ79747.1 hypothetical protein Lac3_09560 [Claveliimonas bilis]